MRASEIRAAGDVAARAFGGGVEDIAMLHEAVADRAFGRRAPFVRAVHDGLARGAYATVARIGGVVARGAAEGVALSRGEPDTDVPALGDGRRGDAALGALNGTFGERFADDESPLAVRMTVRHRGRDLDLDPPTLRRAFPVSRGRIAVLVHGLCMTDASWRWPARLRGAEPIADDRLGYEALLRRDLGLDVLVLRYNSGRRIPRSGAELAGLLERLCAAWPVPVRELNLVGHSMGGLVIRSACAEALEAGHGWPARLGHTVSLGSPNLGANLERVSAMGEALLDLLPETRPLANLLGLRSRGILDLRDGLLLHDDVPLDIDAWPWGERGRAVPLVPGVRHHALGVTLSRDPDSWLARAVIGDLLVTSPSSSGRAKGERRLELADGDLVLLGGLDHFDLVHHPRVYAHLRRWLSPVPALPASGETGAGLVDATVADA